MSPVTELMHECPQCQTMVVDGRRFCSKCGAPQPVTATLAPIACEVCERELPAPMRYCKWCGALQTKYDGIAATTALVPEGGVRDTAGDLTAPPSNTAPDLNANMTAPIAQLRQDDAAISAAAHLTPNSNGAPPDELIEDDAEKTVVRAPMSSAVTQVIRDSAPRAIDNVSTTALSDVDKRAPVETTNSVVSLPRHEPAASKRRNVYALLGVGVVALALGAGATLLVFRNWYGANARVGSANAPQPVVPLAVPNVLQRAPQPAAPPIAVAPSPLPATDTVPPNGVAPTPVVAPSPNVGGVAANVNQSIVGNATSPVAAAVPPARLPAGAPRKGTGEWSGTVQGSVVIEFQGRNQSVVGSAPSLKRAHLIIDNGLPQAPAVLRVNKKKGRGQISVVQQPTAANNYTARVAITNSNTSATEDYTLNLEWEAAVP